MRGASGRVGSIAVQLGHAAGAHVTALAGARNLDLVRELGADEALDLRSTGPADLGTFDVVLDTAGSDLVAYRRLLAEGGCMVTITQDLGRVTTSQVHRRLDRVWIAAGSILQRQPESPWGPVPGVL